MPWIAVLADALAVVKLGKHKDRQQVDCWVPDRELQAGERDTLPVVRTVIAERESGRARGGRNPRQGIGKPVRARSRLGQRPEPAAAEVSRPQSRSSWATTSESSPVMCTSGESRVNVALSSP